MRRKIVTRYTGEKGTLHARINKGTLPARARSVWMFFTTGLCKGYFLEIPTSELKYRGQYIDRLAESAYLSPDL